jgi:hypothetical protein
MLPPSEKIFLKQSKKLNKNLACISWHSMCTHHVSQKINIFCVLCKNTKKNVSSTPILAPKFVFLQTRQKISFSRETTLWEHRLSRSRRKFFHHNILIFCILFKTYFKNATLGILSIYVLLICKACLCTAIPMHICLFFNINIMYEIRNIDNTPSV